MNNCYPEAYTKIKAYRSAYPNKKKGFVITKQDIQDIRDEYGKDIDGIRIYYAMDGSGELQPFYVAVVKDESGNLNDVNVQNATAKADRPCPQMCDNSGSPFA